MLATDHVVTQAMLGKGLKACWHVMTWARIARWHVSTLARKGRWHVSTHGTLAREHVRTQVMLAREHVFSKQGTQLSRLLI